LDFFKNFCLINAKGIVKALMEYNERLKEYKISIYVRRAGPNYQEGLRIMRELGNTLGVAIHVFGPETHMTAIVGMALANREIPKPSKPLLTTANFLLPNSKVFGRKKQVRFNL
jgi:ATP citrate (pro-S)-lyase